MEDQRQAIEALLEERRLFPPPAEFKARARVSDDSLYAEAEADPVGFWMSRALDELTWYREPTQALDDSNPPFFKWFADGELNASVNCLDRHLAAGGGDKTAYIWVGEPGDERVISYQELHDEVNRLANVLRGFGVVKGDRVAIYLGMVPELPMALLACARIGAAHSVVFGGFSAQSLSGRINDAECKVLITADGGWRKGGIVPLKEAADDALADCPSIDHVLVVRRTEQRGRLGRGPRPLVPRPRAGGGRLVRARAHERRGHAVPALHLRHDRQAQGDPAHDRGLPARHEGDPRARVRHPRRRRLLVHRRHRLGDRPLLHRLRAAAEPTRRA